MPDPHDTHEPFDLRAKAREIEESGDAELPPEVVEEQEERREDELNWRAYRQR